MFSIKEKGNKFLLFPSFLFFHLIIIYGDGFSDYEKIQRGFDPLDSSNHPFEWELWMTIVINGLGGVVGLIGITAAINKWIKKRKKKNMSDIDNLEKYR